MLIRGIAGVADGVLVLEPGDRQVEWQGNTWWLEADDGDRRGLSVPEVVAAFERTAERIRARVGAMGFGGVATFYVWHDRPAGQLRCSTGSVAPHELPFSGAYVPSDDLAAVVESFLSDPNPGEVAWSDLDEAQDPPEQAAGEPEDAPFPVWVRGVGPASA